MLIFKIKILIKLLSFWGYQQQQWSAKNYKEIETNVKFMDRDIN